MALAFETAGNGGGDPTGDGGGVGGGAPGAGGCGSGPYVGPALEVSEQPNDAATTIDMRPRGPPDGRSIAYAEYSGDDLFIVDKDGTLPPHPVIFSIPGVPLLPAWSADPTWSADGKNLLVLGSASPSNRLFIIDLETGTTQFVNLPPVQGVLLDAAWSR